MTVLSVTSLIAALAGFLIGLVYFAWLWRSVSSLVNAERTTAGFVIGTISRLTMLAALMGALFWIEIAPVLLLLGGLGFFVARLMATAVLTRPASER